MFRIASALALAAALSFSAVACAQPGDQNEASAVEETSQDIVSRSAAFETFEGLDGQHYFHLLAGNGENVLRSQGYASRSAAEAGVESLILTGSDKRNFEVLEAANGDFYFHLIASNGQILGTSQLFASKASAERSAVTVRALVRLARQETRTQPAPHSERFELFTGEDGSTYFRLRAGNGEIVLGSEGYGDRTAAKSGIASVKAHGITADNFEIVASASGGFFVSLVAPNGQTLARGESYASKSNATRAVNRMVEILNGNVVSP